jgi:hypothetical protein
VRDLVGYVGSLILRTCGLCRLSLSTFLGPGAGQQAYLEVVTKRPVLLLFCLFRTLPWSR